MRPTDPTEPQPAGASDQHDLADFFVEHTEPEAGAAPDDPSEIGRRLTQARRAAGLSPRQLADQLGVTESTVAGWEAGDRSPRGNRVSKLAGILGVSLSWILIGRGVEPSGGHHEISQIRAELRIARSRLDDVVTELADLDRRLAAFDD